MFTPVICIGSQGVRRRHTRRRCGVVPGFLLSEIFNKKPGEKRGLLLCQFLWGSEKGCPVFHCVLQENDDGG